MDTVTMTLQRYDEIKRQNYVLEDELRRCLMSLESCKSQLNKAKEILLKQNLDIYNLDNSNLKELTDYNNWRFGLKNNEELLEIISLEEMVEFITEAKEIHDKEKSEE